MIYKTEGNSETDLKTLEERLPKIKESSIEKTKRELENAGFQILPNNTVFKTITQEEYTRFVLFIQTS